MKNLVGFALALALLVPVSANADIIEEGRKLTALLYAGETNTVWERMNAQMQSAMGNAAALENFLTQLETQLGDETTILEEDVTDVQGYEVYVRTTRFEKSERPINVTWAFDDDGKIAGFSVTPVQKEAPTEYLEYETKTQLSLPFDEPWYVFWGGRTLAENYHTAHGDQRFAYDFLQMVDGKTHTGDGTSNEQYHCWGKRIFSPAAGTVVSTANDVEDNVPGVLNPEQALGNHVILDHGNGEFSFLAHFQKGTVKVALGDEVASGDLLGLAGNSGNTTEAHLHYHLQTTADFGGGDGLPAPFVNYLADGETVELGEPTRGQTVAPATDHDSADEDSGDEDSKGQDDSSQETEDGR